MADSNPRSGHSQPQSTSRRHALATLAAAIGWAMPGASVLAQGYPDKPIRLLVGYPAGGATDQVARLVGQKLSEILGQQVVVMNLPGATGAIAVERVVTSPPDGYTLLLVSVADTVVPALRSKLPYNFERDLVGVAPAVASPLGLVVRPSLPVNNVRELIALAQAQPGKLNYSSPGIGNSLHLAAEQFNSMAKVNITHVPFKGAAEAITATVGGQVDLCFPTLSTVVQLVDAGKLRLLAVTTQNRVASLPQVPTIAESGLPGYSRSAWLGVAAPANTPRDILNRLNAAISKGMSAPETLEQLAKQNFDPLSGSVDQFNALMRSEVAQSAKLIQGLGIKPE